MNILRRELYIMRPIFVVAIFLLFGMCGCDRLNAWRAISNETADNTITTISYNYTGSEIQEILFSNAEASFNVKTAASGGSIFFRLAGTEAMNNGKNVWVGDEACCIVWTGKNKPIRLQVLWHLVFDPDTYERSAKGNDERESLGAFRGSVWCRTIVELPQPYPSRPDALFLHFLPDGTVLARLTERGTPRTGRALPSSLVQSHNRTAAAPHCPMVIDSPWYKIHREPHREYS